MKAEILFVEDRVELAVPTQSRPTKIQNRELGVADGGSFKKIKEQKEEEGEEWRRTRQQENR